MKVTTTKFYCDRCREEMEYPILIRRQKVIKAFGYEIEVCGKCYEQFLKWWRGDDFPEDETWTDKI